MQSNIKIGSKFFKYINNELNVVRITRFEKEKDKITYLDKDNEKTIAKYSSFTNEYKMLKPDGIMMFSIVKIGKATDNTASDVIVALQKFPSEDNIPYAVCRQGIYDFFTDITRKKYDMYNIMDIGISVSQDTCPANIDFRTVLSCDDIVYTKPVAVYLDDSLDTILGLFKTRKFDETIRNYKNYCERCFPNVKLNGVCQSLKELLEINNFMYDFRRCFDIIEVPFSIDEESEELSQENIVSLENKLKIKILETYPIKYTREIDLKSIKRDYVLVSSAQDKYSSVHIIGYDKAE